MAAGTFGLLGFLISTQLPKLRSFISVKIEEVSREHLPVRILPGAVDVSLLPLGATLTKVEIIPKAAAAEFLESASFESIRVLISPWQLLRGKLRLNALEIDGARVSAKIPPLKKSSGPPLEGLFETLGQIPVNEISVRDFSGRLTLTDPKMVLDIANVDLSAEKRPGNAVALVLDSGSVQVRNSAGAAATLKLDLETKLIFSRRIVDMSHFVVRRGDSWLDLAGTLKGDVEAMDFKDVKFEAKTDLNLESTRNWAVKQFAAKLEKMPTFGGRFYASGKIRRAGGGDPEASFSAGTKAFKVLKIFIGDIHGDGTYRLRMAGARAHEILMPKVTVDHPAGGMKVADVRIVSGETTTVSGVASVAEVQIHEALKSFGVGEVPVFMQIAGEVPCGGELAPAFELRCKGKMAAQNLLVRDSMTSKGTIAALRTFSAEGSVTIDKDKVSYATELAMPNSKGRSSGVIDYDNGFKIAYEGDKVSFKDVANLSDLKFEGSGRIKGTTEGDSKSATLELEADLNDFWMEDFWLGQVKGQGNYKAGILNFTNMQGYYAVSRYNGDVKLDLNTKLITVNGRAPFFDVRDVLKVFSHRVKLPFTATGTGQAQIKATGPLAINKLTYDLKTSVFKGTVGGEAFDQAHFDVKSKAGEVNAERVELTKGSSVVILTGQGHPDGTIKTAIQGRAFRLEDSAAILGSGFSLSGQVDFDMTMVGPVLAPDTEMRGRLTKTSIGEQAMADSNYRLKFGSKTIEGDGSLLGDVVKASFVIPFEPTAPFALKVTTTEWNYAPAFAALAGAGGHRDYEGRLSTSIDLAAPTGGFWNSNGAIRVDNFALSRGSLALKSSGPATMQVKNGQFFIDRFDLAGSDNAFVKITASAKPSAKLDLQMSGKIDMNLVGLLTPFLEDLRGIASFSVNMRAGPQLSELLGSAYIEKGYVKFFDFQHPLEDIRIDLLFNQKKILFNTVKAEFGGGRITGSGGLELKGSKNYPVAFTGQFEKVTLNIPDKVRTTGSGTIAFSGSWFPFTLKADYDIKEGLWTKEFGGEAADSGAIRRDQFLPELLLQERFVPLVLDVGINFTKGVVMKNELVDGIVTGSLTVKGVPSKASILGIVNMEKDTKISVKDTPFEVTTAKITLDDPDEINPKLYIAARSRVQEYDVNLLIQGTGAKPDFAFTSVPPLANKDIISLLALGTTEARTGPILQQSNQNVPQTSPSASVSALKNNPLSKEIKEKTGFDLQFAPGFDEQAAVQKIIVKRQFTSKFGVAASQALGSKRATDAEARYQLNDKVSGVLSWQNRDDLNSLDNNAQDKEQNQFGLDLEYKFEFK